MHDVCDTSSGRDHLSEQKYHTGHEQQDQHHLPELGFVELVVEFQTGPASDQHIKQ